MMIILLGLSFTAYMLYLWSKQEPPCLACGGSKETVVNYLGIKQLIPCKWCVERGE